MTGRTIMVTGASRGIGRAVVARLLADGDRVVGVSRSRPDGFPGEHVALDLTTPEAGKRLKQAAAEHGVTGVVANAGIAAGHAFETLTRDDMTSIYEVNVLGAVVAVQAAVPVMRAKRTGRIVLIGSRGALGRAGLASYASSKAALEGLVHCLALEYAADGITANLVSPGPIQTEMFDDLQPEGSDIRAQILARSPTRRLGRPDEVASAIAYFLGDDAGFTTGQTLHVCGGLSVGAA